MCNCDAVLEVMLVLIVEEIDFAVVIVVSSKHEILSDLRTYPTVHPQLEAARGARGAAARIRRLQGQSDAAGGAAG